MHNYKLVKRGSTVKILYVFQPTPLGWVEVGQFTHDCSQCVKDSLGYTKSHVFYHHVRELLPNYYNSMYAINITSGLEDLDGIGKILVTPDTNHILTDSNGNILIIR